LFRSTLLRSKSSLGDDALGGSASFADFPSVDQGVCVTEVIVVRSRLGEPRIVVTMYARV
jgi:hypothetical protein